MDLGLEGKLVLVTGSTSGIGLGIAETFKKCGSKVIINGRSQERVDKTLTKLKEVSNGDAVGVAADLSSAVGAENCIEKVEAFGDLDVLVCNLGIFEVKDFTDISDDEWFNYFNVNVMTAVRVIRHFLPRMLARNQGRIIIISSEGGVKPLPNMIHYCVTKTALISLARGLAETTKGTGVTVNSVLPGPTATEGLQNYFRTYAEKIGKPLEEATSQYFKEFEPTSLIQRPAEVKEVASIVVFLASQLASAINGNAQRVEGGVIRSIL